MYQVIIIEDDPMVAAINRQYVELTPSFHVAGIFKNGIPALDFLKKQAADLIILDYYTPLMNGMEFIDRLHASGLSPSVIMVTSANDAETVRGLLSRGVVDYLVKPFEYERFRSALERFSRRQENLNHIRSGMDQGEIDRLLTPGGLPSASPHLTKGLNETTLELVRRFLKEHSDSAWSSEQVAEQVHLSRITIRRYLNYMVETGELITAVDYQTGGRPSIKYQCASRKRNDR